MNLKGNLIISNNVISQDYFSKSVILVTENNKNYSTGLILNKISKRHV